MVQASQMTVICEVAQAFMINILTQDHVVHALERSIPNTQFHLVGYNIALEIGYLATGSTQHTTEVTILIPPCQAC